MKRGDSWHLLPLGWCRIDTDPRDSNIGLKDKGGTSDLVAGLGASIWSAYNIKKDWRKKSEKTKDNLLGAQEKTWNKLSFSLSIIRDIEMLMMFNIALKYLCTNTHTFKTLSRFGKSCTFAHYFTQIMHVAPENKIWKWVRIPKLPRSHRDCYFRWSEKFWWSHT